MSDAEPFGALVGDQPEYLAGFGVTSRLSFRIQDSSIGCYIEHTLGSGY
jgi:hypothetical protein